MEWVFVNNSWANKHETRQDNDGNKEVSILLGNWFTNDKNMEGPK
jgi:hypothetical protein